MYNSKQIINIYNLISNEELKKEDLVKILPKLYLILNKVELDEIEIVCVIDTLKELEKNEVIDRVTVEIIDLINKILKNDEIILEGTVYFSEILRHTILPFNKNICSKEYNLMLFLSEFEIYIELISQKLKKKELEILDKYNHELTETVKEYKKVENIYKRIVYNDVMLSSMISHFASMLYFNLEEYDYEYGLIEEVFKRIVSNYQEFIDYCCSMGIHRNYTRIQNDISNIELEYIIGNEMLKYVYENKEEKKIKRK